MTVMTAFRCPMALPLIVVAVLMAMSSAAAQSRQPPRTSEEIQAQIQKSAELQRQALQSLHDPGRAEQLIDKAYAELRAALSTMIINASGMKFQDPLLSIQIKRGEQALSLLQGAGDVLKINQRNQPVRPAPEDQENGQPGGSRAYLDEVRKNLEQALHLTNMLAF